MKKGFALAAVLTILVTGCGTESAPPASDPNVPPATSGGSGSDSSEPGDENRSDRGNLQVEVGEPTGYSVDGTRIVDFVVTAIEVDPACTEETALPPENGHFVVVTMEVETAPELADELNPYFIPSLFKAIAANGTMMNGVASSNASFACLAPSEMISSTMEAGQRATGKVVLDVTTPSGVLILDDFNDAETWEFVYPSEIASA